MHTDETPESLPSNLRIGNGIDAEYNLISNIPQYENNPCIASLPPILNPKEAANLFACYPSLPKERDENPAIRMHQLEAALQAWYQPTSGTIELAHTTDLLLRAGYQARNPFLAQYHRTREHDLQRLLDAAARSRSRSTSLTTRFVGASGMGKTTGLETVTSRYPQVIYHREFQGRPFQFTQLVWVHMDCPFDGSPRGLCLNFLATVDDILGTKYHGKYSNGRSNTDQLLMAMARVVRNHALGLLVMDEVNVLRDIKTEGATKLLSFFVQMVNMLRVPIMLVGTCRASKLFGRAFRQARRGMGQGALTWLPFPKNHPDWHLLFDSLSQYQVMDVPVTNPDQLAKLRDVLHEESAGIIDIAVKLWKFAQWRGLACEHASLSPKLIKSVAKDSLGEVRNLLRAYRLKRLDVEGLEDIEIIDDDTFLKSTKSSREEALFALLQNLLQARQQQAGGEKTDAASAPSYNATDGSVSDEQAHKQAAASAAQEPASAPNIEVSEPLLKDMNAEAAGNTQRLIQGFRDRGLMPLSDNGAGA